MEQSVIKIEYGRSNAILPFKGTGNFWSFDNGQYGEKTESTARKEYYLAYNYNRVYVSSRTRHNMEGGPTTDSMQAPLSCYNSNAEIMAIALKLFESDKVLGIIPTEYPFI